MLMIGYVLIIAGLPKGRDVCWSVRSPSVVCAVVISRKLSKIDANTIRKLPLFILSLHSNLLPDAPPRGRGNHPLLGEERSIRHPLSERYRLALGVSAANDLFELARREG